VWFSFRSARIPQGGAGEVMALAKTDAALYLGEERNGCMKVASPKGDGWVKKVLLKKP
jgi:hypothetical protein